MKITNLAIIFCGALIIGAGLASGVCAQKKNKLTTQPAQIFVEDAHSYSNPKAVRVRHVDLDWDVLFDKKILQRHGDFDRRASRRA